MTKPRTFQAFLVVDFRARQVLEAHRVHHQAHAIALDHGIVIGDIFVEGEAILEARATAAGDGYTQFQARIASSSINVFTLLAAPRVKQGRRGEGLDAHVSESPGLGRAFTIRPLSLLSQKNGQLIYGFHAGRPVPAGADWPRSSGTGGPRSGPPMAVSISP